MKFYGVGRILFHPDRNLMGTSCVLKENIDQAEEK